MGSSGLITDPWPHVELTDFIEGAQNMIRNWPEIGWERINCNTRRRYQPVARAFPEVAKELLSGDTERFFCNALGVAQKPLYPVAMLIDDSPGYAIRPHTDCAGKVITCQVYLGEGPESQGVVLLGNGLEKQIPYRFNSGYAFEVTKQSWHKVYECKEPRRSIQILYYDTPNPKF